jgi:alcohol dehydrogenase
MAILLPYGLEYNMHKSRKFIAELLLPLAGPDIYSKTPGDKRAEKVVELIRKMNDELYLATDKRHSRCLKEVMDRDGKQMIPKEKIIEIAKVALSDPASIYNPEEADYDDNLMVLEAAWEGKPLDRKKIKKG